MAPQRTALEVDLCPTYVHTTYVHAHPHACVRTDLPQSPHARKVEMQNTGVHHGLKDATTS